jgi:hypothetical protein
LSTPPPGWPQRTRAGLPFPPGRDGERFEVYVSADVPYHINLATFEVYRPARAGWAAPGWLALPPSVRARLWTLHREAAR